MQLEKLVGRGKAGPCLTEMQLKEKNEGERTDSAVFLVRLHIRIVMTIKTVWLLVIFKLCTSL